MNMKWVSVGLAVLMLSMGGAQADQQSSSGKNKQKGQAGEFDYYLLSLSWSPTFCLTHAGNEQCKGKGYGFVLHGLWPQYAKGGWPQFCAPLTPLTAAQRQQGRTMFPTAKLLDMSGANTVPAAAWALTATSIPPTRPWARCTFPMSCSHRPVCASTPPRKLPNCSSRATRACRPTASPWVAAARNCRKYGCA